MLVLLSKLLNASSCAAIFLARRKLTFETVQGYIHIFLCEVLKSKTRRMVTQGNPATHLFHRALKRKTSFKISIRSPPMFIMELYVEKIPFLLSLKRIGTFLQNALNVKVNYTWKIKGFKVTYSQWEKLSNSITNYWKLSSKICNNFFVFFQSWAILLIWKYSFEK